MSSSATMESTLEEPERRLEQACLSCVKSVACSCQADKELLPVCMIKKIQESMKHGEDCCRQCGEHRSRTDLEYRRTDASGLIPVAVCKKHEHEKNDAKELVVCISSQLAGSESYRQACTAANFFNELYTPAKVVVTVEKVKDPPVVLPDTPATGFVMVFPKSGDRTPDSVLWYAHDKRYSRSTLAAEDLARVLTGLPRLHYTAPSTSTFMDRTKNFAGNVSSYGQNLTDNEKTTTYFKKVVETCPHCKSSSMPECGMCGSCEALFVSVVKEPYLTISCTKDNIGSECTAILLAGLVIGAHKKDDMTCTIKRTRVSMYACSECFHFQNGTNYKCETCTTLLAPSVASVEKTWKKKNYVAVHMDMSHLGHPPKGILLPNAVTTDNLEKMTSEVHSINSLWKRCNNISTKGHAPYCNERCLGSCGGLVVSQQGPVTPNRVYPAVPEPLLRVDPVVKPEPSTPEPEPEPEPEPQRKGTPPASPPSAAEPLDVEEPSVPTTGTSVGIPNTTLTISRGRKGLVLLDTACNEENVIKKWNLTAEGELSIEYHKEGKEDDVKYATRKLKKSHIRTAEYNVAEKCFTVRLVLDSKHQLDLLQ